VHGFCAVHWCTLTSFVQKFYAVIVEVIAKERIQVVKHEFFLLSSCLI